MNPTETRPRVAVVGAGVSGLTAAYLLQPTHHVTLFDADVKAGVPDQERVKRLGGSIQFARDLYAQRAALETSPSADILEDEIAEIVRAEAPSPFAAALGGAVRDRQAQTA